MLRIIKQWWLDTPDRALDQAYRAALTIKAIEDEHFNGQQVSRQSQEYSDSVFAYFQAEIENNLRTIKRKLGEFKSSRSLVNAYEPKSKYLKSNNQYPGLGLPDKSAIIIEKLNFIDQVTSKYKNKTLSAKKQTTSLAKPTNSPAKNSTLTKKNNSNKNNNFANQAGVLPRSIFRTILKIKQDIDPESAENEEEVLSKFRRSRNKTFISIKFLLILIIIPLLAHQISKTFLIKPVVESYFTNHQPTFVFINTDLEQEALLDLKNFEDTLRLKGLIGLTPKLTQEEIEAEVKHEANEIVTEYQHRGFDGIENVFADLFSLAAFIGVLLFSQKEIAILKSFIDEIIYGLSDSAKAFLIILFTDIFVGYHSPHGWEVILEGIARHFGLPENREFNFLFIATFPVILDTVLKYWIFRYLNRISPSAVATYRNMNE